MITFFASFDIGDFLIVDNLLLLEDCLLEASYGAGNY